MSKPTFLAQYLFVCIIKSTYQVDVPGKDIYQDKSKVPSTSKTEKHVIKANTFKTKTLTFFIRARQWENCDLFY